MSSVSAAGVSQVSIRRLGPGDRAILELLAREDPDFDLDERSEPRPPLPEAQADAYLQNPAVLHWIATAGETITGFLYCLHIPLRSGAGQELLLYEIGVRKAWRRRGVGRALLQKMEQWMRESGVSEVWVLADNQAAVAFYQALGFAAAEPEPGDLPTHAGPVYLIRSL